VPTAISIIVFFTTTPKGLRPVHDGLVFTKPDLPEVSRLISSRGKICNSSTMDEQIFRDGAERPTAVIRTRFQIDVALPTNV
jgi:hypothetical protein